MVNDKIVNGFMKLSIKEKLGYSLGDTASHFVWDLVGFWLLIFYTDIYGLSPALAVSSLTVLIRGGENSVRTSCSVLSHTLS